MIHIGFSGTQRGMTAAQLERVRELVGHRTLYAHHGDCVGADAEFDAIVRSAPGLYGVVMHPSNVVDKRAYCPPRYPHDVVRDPLDPLVRNANIVSETACLIAAPKTMSSVQRSGTWMTIRLAIAQVRPVAILFPNGAMIFEGTWP